MMSSPLTITEFFAFQELFESYSQPEEHHLKMFGRDANNMLISGNTYIHSSSSYYGSFGNTSGDGLAAHSPR